MARALKFSDVGTAFHALIVAPGADVRAGLRLVECGIGAGAIEDVDRHG